MVAFETLLKSLRLTLRLYFKQKLIYFFIFNTSSSLYLIKHCHDIHIIETTTRLQNSLKFVSRSSLNRLKNLKTIQNCVSIYYHKPYDYHRGFAAFRKTCIKNYQKKKNLIAPF